MVGVAVALSLLVVVALWVSNQGVRDLSRGWTAAVSLGRLTGLVAADLMLVQVLLIARIPIVERCYGQDRLARWHRVVGFASVTLLATHVVLTTLGYSASVRRSVAEFWHLIVDYPGMLLAFAATVAFAGVAVTSLRAARRRLRYESWHLLHLYAYLGVGLALPHQLWTGTDFVDSPAARAYWWTLYGATAGAVVVFRLGVPLARSAVHRLTVTRVVAESPDVVSVYLTGRRLDRLSVRAGHFFNWRFLAGPGWTRAHPYSLSAPPTGDELRITIKNLGDDSGRAARLRPGTRAIIEGPYGRLTGDGYRGGPVTMLGCGIGITPLRALLGELRYPPGAATLIYRARSEADLVLRAELEALAAERGVRVVYMLGQRADRRSWQSADAAARHSDVAARHSDIAARHSDVAALRELVPDIADHDVYLCGPGGWVAAARAAAIGCGVPPRNLHFESFNW